MKLLIKVNNTETGMYYHRLRVPFERMANTMPVQIEETQLNDKGQSVVMREIPQDVLRRYDAVIFSRQIETDHTSTDTMNYLQSNGVKVIFDIDDYWNIESGHKLAKAYKEEGISEQMLTCIKGADLVFTPTPYLTEAVKQHNPNAYTIKTCIDIERPQWTSTATESPLKRFGWVGGVHHIGDIKLMEKSINKVHQKLEGYQFCLGGFNYAKKTYTHQGKTYVSQQSEEYVDIERVFTGNYNFTDPDYKEYLLNYTKIAEHVSYFQNYRRLWAKDINNYATLYDELDICLVPLSGNGLFNQYKSELKLIEAGAKGKMCIVSRVKPYTLIPDEYVHFVDSSDMIGWYKAIKYCIDNPEYVKEKALALKEHIKDNYNLDKENEKRFNLIKAIL